MPTLMILITIILYGAALYLWVRQRSYRYTVVLAGGHLMALLEPLWQRLYYYSYTPSSSDLTLMGKAVPLYIVLSMSWLFALPALALFFAQRQRWWPRHYLAGLAAFVSLVLYHVIIQGLARLTDLWKYTLDAPHWGSNALLYQLFLALMGALVSMIIVYALVATRYYAAEIAVPVLIGSMFVAPLLVYGILGAPFWLPRLIEPSTWILRGGVVVTLGLIAWVVHLACWGLHASRRQQVRWG